MSLEWDKKMVDYQNARGQMLADARQAAHERFMQGRANFIASNPGAVSPQERQSVLGRAREVEDRKALWQQEMAMQQAKNEGAIGVEEQRKLGVIGAAEKNAEATMHKADAEKEAAIREWEKRGEIAQTEADASTLNEMTKADAAILAAQERGRSDVAVAEQKKLGDIQVAREQGKSALEVQREKNKGINDALAFEDAKANSPSVRLRMAEQRAFDAWMDKVLKPDSMVLTREEKDALTKMTPDEQRDFFLRKTGRIR